ncbi:MAG: bifunctional pyr operon transcriptional regulator/uracil phosphoribosyltransferase PyrR [Gemmatimonadota bacterium]
MTATRTPRVLLDAAGVEQTLLRLARRIAEWGETSDLLLVGIRRRGAELADRLARALSEIGVGPIPTGSLDITLYRDDFAQIGPRPLIGTTEIPGDITGRRVVIVDDVLHTGRTVRAALNELADFGRARRIELCALVDRGGRELPIRADHVGLSVDVGSGEEVAVRVPELDGELAVAIVPVGGSV